MSGVARGRPGVATGVPGDRGRRFRIHLAQEPDRRRPAFHGVAAVETDRRVTPYCRGDTLRAHTASRRSMNMHALRTGLVAFALVAVAVAQSPEPPLSDSRLTVHTLLREDVFA